MSCLVPVLPNPPAPRSVSLRAATFLTWGVSILFKINWPIPVTCLDYKVFSRVIEKYHVDLAPIIRIYYSHPNVDKISDGKP